MEKLKAIMDAEIERTNKFKSIEEISQFEKVYKINLPNVYKQFLLEYGSGYIKDNFFYKPLERTPLTPDDGYDSTNYFYGSDIIDNLEIYYEELDQKLIPIADSGCGDFICLGIKDKYNGKVFYWSHEMEDDKYLNKKLFLIANTFKDFILTFEKRVQNFSLDDIELFLDDDLLND